MLNPLQPQIEAERSRLLHGLPSEKSYDIDKMTDLFELYHNYLVQTDRDYKTIERYWTIARSFKEWLNNRQPNAITVTEYLSYLRGKSYAQRSILLYYHALRDLFNFMNKPLNLKLRKPKSLPQYTGKDKIEKLILAAQEGLQNHTETMKKRNTAIR